MRYFDTSVLIKGYLWETDSPKAVALLTSAAVPIPVTELSLLEMRSAIRQKRARKDISEARKRKVMEAIDHDLASGSLELQPLAWTQVFAQANQLSEKHMASTLCRSLDTLHVATALELGATEFCTFDQRQRVMAQAAGMTVLS